MGNVEDIRIGLDVYSGDEKVGTVARLVADASDAHITDIVVDRGLLHGAKLIPLDEVSQVQNGRIQLRLTREQFQNADGFADQRFRQPEDDWSGPPGYLGSDFLLDLTLDGGAAAGYGVVGKPSPFPPSPADPRPNLLRPALREGTPILDVSGKQVGHVAEVSFHPEDGRLDGLVLRRGLLGHEQVSVPVDWIEGVDEDGVVLHVQAAEVERLTGQVKATERPDPAG